MKKFFLPVNIICIALAIAFIGAQRPQERVSTIQTPDGKHFHQLYKQHPIRMEIQASAQGLSGIGIQTLPSDISLSDLQLTILGPDGTVIPNKTTIHDTNIHASFNPQKGSKGNIFSVSLETLSLQKDKALFLPYQSDPTKYPNVHVWQGNEEKQGSLGITEYEKPTIALMVARWLSIPHQRTLWIGIIISSIGYLTSQYLHPTNANQTRKLTPSRRMAGYYIAIFVSILIVYWPATTLFFYSDDVPIIARTEVLKESNPALLFLPYQYTERDPQSRFGFDFWRPVSFAMYPLLLSLLPGTPSAPIYYFINITILALTGCLLFNIAYHVFKSHQLALLATAIWAFSSTKLGVAYWWSSSQDILASLFAMGSIVLALRQQYKAALMLYILGVFSKEYVIVTPVVIIAIQFLKKMPLQQLLHTLSRYMIFAGIFLILNTAALGNPWIPQDHKANTYAFSLEPVSIIRNIIIYTSASVESRLWPTNGIYGTVDEILYKKFELWRAKTSGPYYPGVLLITLWTILLIVFQKQRKALLFGALWWIIYLGPILLFANDWKVRWLMLSLFGMGIFITAVAQQVRAPRIVVTGLTLLLVAYGYSVARNERLTRFHREQSAYTLDAYTQLQKQQEGLESVKRIMLTGITEEQETSLNAYLFRIYAKNPDTDIIYYDSPPQKKLPGDIIITMDNKQPYYPESEK